MLVPFICNDCGEAGSVLLEQEADIPRCPRCAGELSIERTGDEEPVFLHGDLDDDVVSWVSQPSESPEVRSGGEIVCSACGYAGVMSYDSDQGDAICPACMTVFRKKRPPGYVTIDCPSCGQIVEYSDIDRGKTIICPGCKYFLGCLVPPEKHAYRSRGLR